MVNSGDIQRLVMSQLSDVNFTKDQQCKIADAISIAVKSLKDSDDFDKDHTPGPWLVEESEDSGTVWISAPQSAWHGLCSVVTHIDDSAFENAQGRANANLISAAPEMYDVLSRLAFYHGPGTCPDDIFEDMNAVLKKAEGNE